MKPILTAVFILLTTCLAPAQQMRFDSMLQDMGEMGQSEARDVNFTIYNTGTDTLHLSRPRAGCGCTHVRLANSSVAPGDSSSLSVRFMTGPHMLGEIIKAIEIGEMRGPNEFNVQKLRIRAEVVGEVYVQPTKLAFRATVGDTVRLRLTLTSRAEEDVPLRHVTPVLTAFVDTSREGNYRADRVVTEPFEAITITPSSQTVHAGGSMEIDISAFLERRGQINGFLRIVLPHSEIRVPVTGVVLNQAR